MNKSEVVKNAAQGRWLEIFKALTSKLDDACESMPNHVACPVAGGTNGFRLFKEAKDIGAGISNQHGTFHNGLDLLMWVLDEDFPTVLKMVSDYLELDGKEWRSTTPVAPKKAPIKDNSKALAKCRISLRKAWQTAYDLTSPEAKVARKYLNSRGLDLTKLDLHGLSKTVRFNPSMPLYEFRTLNGKKENVYVGNFPAIISLVFYPDGKAATIHRTFLDQYGNKLKLEVHGEAINPKKIMSRCEDRPITGSAIHLSQTNGTTIHVAEGLETALSVKQTLTERGITDEPVFCCISTTILAKFQPPKRVKNIVVWADKDRPREFRGKTIEAGLDAATELADRMDQFDVWTFIMYPQHEIPDGAKSVDWNDVLVQQGSAAFPDYQREIWLGVA